MTQEADKARDVANVLSSKGYRAGFIVPQCDGYKMAVVVHGYIHATWLSREYLVTEPADVIADDVLSNAVRARDSALKRNIST